jgi:hypothetical protein
MPDDPHKHQPVVFTSDSAVFLLWLFMAAYMAMLILLTSAAIVASNAPTVFIAILAALWVAGLAFAQRALRTPRVRVEFSPAGVLVRENAPLWKRDRQFAAKNVSVSDVVEAEDREYGGF